MAPPVFGITIQRADDDARPAVWDDLSVIGLVGTAPAADATAYPLNEPVLIRSSDRAKLTALGATGTLPDAVKLIDAQLGPFQSAALIVVVRVQAGSDTAGTIAALAGNAAAGTGVYALLEAGPALGHTPRLIAVPGFTSQITAPATTNGVIAALSAVLPRLLAHAVVSGPGTGQQAAITWRESINSDRIIPIEPGAMMLDDDGTSYQVDAAPAILGIAVRRDFEFGGRPFHSWANQPVYGITGLSRPVPFSLTDGASEGQALLTANVGVITRGDLGVAGAIGDGGFVFIGTDNAGSDELWRFYNVMRGRDYIHLALLRSIRTYLGRFNLTGQTIQAVRNTIHGMLAQLQADGEILGFTENFVADQNDPDNLRQGRIVVRFQAEEAPVLRHITVESGRYRPALDALINDLASV